MSPKYFTGRSLFSTRRRNSSPFNYMWILRNLHSMFSGSLISQPSPDPPSISLAVAVLVGLPLTLWTFKCVSLVLFQRKIIYMGYAPPGSRSEILKDAQIPRHIHAEHIAIPSSEGIFLHSLIMRNRQSELEEPDCVLVYLQGNAGNPLHRIPVFTTLLDACRASNTSSPTIFAPAPRSYWMSTNRTPTQRGILIDYLHAINYATERWPNTPLVLYGHSLGGAVATCLLATLDDADTHRNLKPLVARTKERCAPAIRGLILENPFSSIPDMVRELYPQRWLPYRYLAPLSWDKWGALGALRECTSRRDDANGTSVLRRVTREALVVVSEKDEVVPRSMGEAMYREMSDGMEDEAPVAVPVVPAAVTVNQASSTDPPPGSRSEPRLLVIKDALHENAWMQRQWAVEIARYLEKFRRRSST